MNSSMIIISFIIFAGLVAVITYFKTRNDNMETSDGYFLGGRSLTAIVVAGSLMLLLKNLITMLILFGIYHQYASRYIICRSCCPKSDI